MFLKFRKFAILLVCAFTVIFVVFAGGSSLSAQIFGNGKGDIKLTVDKAKAAEASSDYESFKDYIEAYVSVINSQSADTDVLSVKKYEETETEYRITITTRRIDTVKGLGQIRYGDTKGFCETNTNNLDDVKDGYDAFIIPSILRVYPNKSPVTLKTDDGVMPLNKIKIEARSTKNGDILSFNDFKNELLATDANRILFFQLADFQIADEIEVKLPGDVKFVSVMTKTDTNEEIDTVSASGNTVVIKATQLMFSTGTANAFFGYFVYGSGFSGWAIAGIIIGVVGIGFFVFFGIIKGGIKRFFKSNVWRRMMRYKVLYIMILPAIALIIMFRYMPMIWLSAGFMEYDILKGLGSEWIGLKYFKGVFYATNTPEMYQIFRNTIFISLIRIFSNLPVILLLAVLVNSIKNRKFRTVFQTISFIPYFLSWVAIGGIFNALLDPNTGIINKVLGVDINWYGDPDPWWAILSISSLWKGMGWGTLIYISAMCNIDDELYEACALDGGGIMRQTFTVTLPGIMNIICLQLILDVSNIMRDNYEQILAMTNGQVTGAIQETVDVVGRISYTALSKGNFGSATAIGLIQGVIGSILVLITNRIVKKTENEGII